MSERHLRSVPPTPPSPPIEIPQRIRRRLWFLGIPLFQSTPPVRVAGDFARCLSILEALIANGDKETIVALQADRGLWLHLLGYGRPASVSNARDGDLYFIENPRLNLIKIGIARSVARRQRELERSCGTRLKLLRVVPDGARYERSLHDALSPFRREGEWFLATGPVLLLVREPSRIPQIYAGVPGCLL